MWINAGYAAVEGPDGIDADFFDRMMNTNVRGPTLQLSRHSEHLNTGASVVLTSSTATYEGSATASVYTATKGALLSMGPLLGRRARRAPDTSQRARSRSDLHQLPRFHERRRPSRLRTRRRQPRPPPTHRHPRRGSRRSSYSPTTPPMSPPANTPSTAASPNASYPVRKGSASERCLGCRRGVLRRAAPGTPRRTPGGVAD